nr:scarecrow-like protein 8 [Ipomoea batatas]
MSSGFPGSVQEFYGGPDGISNGRSVPVGSNIGNLMQQGGVQVQVPYGSQLPGIVSDSASQIAHRRSDLIGKTQFSDISALAGGFVGAVLDFFEFEFSGDEREVRRSDSSTIPASTVHACWER